VKLHQPITNGALIIIDKRDEIPEGVANSSVSGKGNVLLGLAIVADRNRRPRRACRHNRFRGTTPVVVDYHNLERVTSIQSLIDKGIEQSRQER
jgi:hypothetical protein